MARWFNVAGPCKPDIHYMLPAAARLPAVSSLVDQQSYFVLHAPRQSGKTTAMLNIAQELMAAGRYVAVLVSAEVGAPFGDAPDLAEQAMLDSWQADMRYQLAPEFYPQQWPTGITGRHIGAFLGAWASQCPLPLVVFIDEIDALRDTTLISVLRQLRDGFRRRPGAFPWALALVGLRDVRDYKVASGGSERLHSASPFNIKTRSLTLGNFTLDDVAALYQQHTADTGQVFEYAAIQEVMQLTQGQPWLVNALAKMAVEEISSNLSQAITVSIISQAKEELIRRQDTHLDSLAERLREPRVRSIIEPILSGQALGNVPPDDLRFVQDLGLVRLEPEGGLVIANPIYREVLPQVLASTAIASLPQIVPSWLSPQGSLDIPHLLEAFLAFWRQHGEPLLATSPYAEIAPHVVLMAFLHRVANGGGTIEREYAIGRDRMDLLLTYGSQRLAIEIKVWRDHRPDPLTAGLAQIDSYLLGLGLDSGWLVIFDQRRNQAPIAERTTTFFAQTPAQHEVTVIRA